MPALLNRFWRKLARQPVGLGAVLLVALAAAAVNAVAEAAISRGAVLRGPPTRGRAITVTSSATRLAAKR